MEVQIMQVIDIDGRQYSDDLMDKIAPFATYMDQVLWEHLYDPAGILELDGQEGTEPVFSSEEKNTLAELQQLMVKHNAAYCRFVFP